jgi:hypothetical protein
MYGVVGDAIHPSRLSRCSRRTEDNESDHAVHHAVRRRTIELAEISKYSHMREIVSVPVAGVFGCWLYGTVLAGQGQDEAEALIIIVLCAPCTAISDSIAHHTAADHHELRSDGYEVHVLGYESQS